ncbi:TPA: DUF2726 domain-containing protein [Burkholderia vietnamiensis]|nr:DUF2726 domain-containing protein [Burkholderia vietnamiensis]
MSRKNKKSGATRSAAPVEHRTSSTASNAASQPAAGITLEDLRKQVHYCVEAEQWGLLLDLVDPLTPSSIVDKTEHEAEFWLLSSKVVAWTKGHLASIEFVEAVDRTALKGAVMRMAELAQFFYKAPEFDIYLRLLDFSMPDALHALDQLTRACMEPTQFKLIERLRSIALSLMFPDEHFAAEGTLLLPEEKEPLERLPDLDLLLREAYARAWKMPGLGDDDKIRLLAMHTELDMLAATPADAPAVRASLAKLPEPVLPPEYVSEDVDDEYVSRQELTPAGWGFLWEMSFAQPGDYAAILERYPGPFAHDFSDGLAALMRSILATHEDERDRYLVSAVNYLSRYARVSDISMGALMVQGADGPLWVPFAFSSLRTPMPVSLLLDVIQPLTKAYPRLREACQLYLKVVHAIASSGTDDTKQAHMQFEDLAWLREKSCRFQWMAMESAVTLRDRMRFLLGALAHPQAAVQLSQQSLPVLEGDLSAEDIRLVIPLLEALAARREELNSDAARLWRASAVAVFDKVLSAKGDALERVVELSRELSEDLETPRGWFIKGYLEQVSSSGTRYDALCFYASSLSASYDGLDAIKGNLARLWKDETSIEDMKEHLDLLGAVKTTDAQATKALAQIRESAQRRLHELQQADQHERTAVNRWPALSAPAKTVLATLHQIDGFKGYEELGRYAGMSAEWAGKHHKRLLDEGMVRDTPTGYTVNPYIIPLLERENQHSVAGRIVRANGTAAIKQVFNSEREFSIYQVVVQLCPNHLVFPNCSLQSIMSYDRLKELVDQDDFGYYLRASVDIVVVSSTTYLPMLAIEVDSPWHDTDRQQERDVRKDRLFSTAGIPFLRLRPLGRPTPEVVRAEVASHIAELVSALRSDIPGYDQAQGLLRDLARPGD